MLDLPRALAELAAAGATLPGVTAYDHVPESVEVPAWYPGEVAIDYGADFRESATVTVTCRVLVGRSVDGAGQHELAALMGTGPGSVYAALQAARGGPGEYALNGACDDLAVSRVTGHRLYTLGGTETYVGAEWSVQLIGDGDA